MVFEVLLRDVVGGWSQWRVLSAGFDGEIRLIFGGPGGRDAEGMWVDLEKWRF